MSEPILINWTNLFLLAAFGATATVGLTTGTLAPFFPTITRTATPRRYWFGIAVFGGLVLLNIVRVLLLI